MKGGPEKDAVGNRECESEKQTKKKSDNESKSERLKSKVSH